MGGFFIFPEPSNFYCPPAKPGVYLKEINSFIDTALDKTYGSIYKALLTGDRSSLSPEIIEIFKASGCMHILAISGIHMSILGAFIFTLLFWLFRRSEYLILHIDIKKWAAFLCILPLFTYTLLAGAKTPVLRSFLMSLIVIIAICTGRKHSAIPLISAAALLILLFHPGELFEPSFQLSFLAILSIFLLLPHLAHIKKYYLKNITNQVVKNGIFYFISVFLVSIVATFSTTPILLFHFNRISFIGVLSNLIIEPLVCLWSLTCGFIAVLFLPLSQFTAKLFLQFGSFGLQISLEVLSFLSASPVSSIYLTTPPLFLIIIYYLLFTTVLLRPNFLVDKLKGTVLLGCIGVTILLFIFPPQLFWEKFKPQQSNLFKIVFLDVRHGSCTYIQFPSGTKVLIDGGTLFSPRYDIGAQVIAPFLWDNGIQQIDHVIVTHQDIDHYSGIPFILKNFKVKNIWVNSKQTAQWKWHGLLDSATKNNVPVNTPKNQEYVHLNTNKSESILIMENGSSTNAYNSNDRGLVIKLRYKDLKALFPGDITNGKERELTRMDLDLSANVLLAPHHGSTTSNSRLFLESVQPEIIVLSSSPTTKMKYKSKNLEMWKTLYQTDVFDTAVLGEITLYSNGTHHHISTFSGTKKQNPIPRLIR